MIKKFRLEFLSKKPGMLKSAWRELIDAGDLTSNLGVLTGSFLADSSELSRVLEFYERDKVDLGVRMESSCIVQCEPSDIDSYSFFKLFPPNAKAVDNEERLSLHCKECGRRIGCNRLRSPKGTIAAMMPNCAIAMTTAGDLFLRDDLVEKITHLDSQEGLHLDAVSFANGSCDWSIVLRAPAALRVGTRAGFCQTCGGAIKSELLPEMDETYRGDQSRNFLLSPDLPNLPCFSSELTRWLIDNGDGLSWGHFKPITFQSD